MDDDGWELYDVWEAFDDDSIEYDGGDGHWHVIMIPLIRFSSGRSGAAAAAAK